MLPEGILAARGRMPIVASAVTLFPQPDSPTRPRVSPGRTSNEMPLTAWTSPRLRLEADAEIVDLEKRAVAHVRPRSFGSRASRRPSPIRLKPITAITIATPGKIARNGAVCR